MKKLLAVMLALVLVASMSVMAFATEGETIPSPTDAPVFDVDFTTNESDTPVEVPVEAVVQGEELTLTAPVSEDKEFVGFVIVGEYEVISGAEYIVETVDGAISLKIPGGCSIVIVPKGDIKVEAHYTSETTTEPTQPTEPDDDDGDSPQTGDDTLLIWVAVIAILGVAGCALAVKKLSAKKEN